MARGLQSAGSVVVATDLVVLQHVGSSHTRNRTCVPCVARHIINLWTCREALLSSLPSLFYRDVSLTFNVALFEILLNIFYL